MNRWEQYVARWGKCTRCKLHQYRKRVVLAKGPLPNPLCFIGEAPGDGEDVIGVPFVGPAGHLLDYIVEEALRGYSGKPPAFSNVLACIPKVDWYKTDPPDWAIKQCRPRLLEFLQICQPKLIIAVGDIAYQNISGGRTAQVVKITHPARILRLQNENQPGASIVVKRCIVKIADSVARVLT